MIVQGSHQQSCFYSDVLLGPGDWVEGVQKVEDPQSMFSSARQSMQKRNKTNKIAYDKKRSMSNVKVGDSVLLKSHPLSNMKRNLLAKLAPKWKGPYKVVAQLSPVNFHIQLGDDVRVAHTEQLKVVV